MEDYHVAKFINMRGQELGLFAIFDGHLGNIVPAYLQKHLFTNILKEVHYPLFSTFCISFQAKYVYLIVMVINNFKQIKGISLCFVPHDIGTILDQSGCGHCKCL